MNLKSLRLVGSMCVSLRVNMVWGLDLRLINLALLSNGNGSLSQVPQVFGEISLLPTIMLLLYLLYEATKI